MSDAEDGEGEGEEAAPPEVRAVSDTSSVAVGTGVARVGGVMQVNSSSGSGFESLSATSACASGSAQQAMNTDVRTAPAPTVPDHRLHTVSMDATHSQSQSHSQSARWTALAPPAVAGATLAAAVAASSTRPMPVLPPASWSEVEQIRASVATAVAVAESEVEPFLAEPIDQLDQRLEAQLERISHEVPFDRSDGSYPASLAMSIPADSTIAASSQQQSLATNYPYYTNYSTWPTDHSPSHSGILSNEESERKRPEEFMHQEEPAYFQPFSPDTHGVEGIDRGKSLAETRKLTEIDGEFSSFEIIESAPEKPVLSDPACSVASTASFARSRLEFSQTPNQSSQQFLLLVGH